MTQIFKPYEEQTLIERLRNRAIIRRQAKGRKSVEKGETDRLAALLEEAANEIERLSPKPRIDGMKCAICGTTTSKLYYHGNWYGYRCSDDDCQVF